MTPQSDAAVRVLRERGITEPLELVVVLGTGLGAIADSVENPIVVPYADLPGFPTGSVSGHEKQLVVGTWEGTRVAIMQGRTHYYETGDAGGMTVPIETLAQFGAPPLLLTNSAGSLHLDWYPGSLAIISDHINFSGVNPLIGQTGDERFVPLADAYDKRLRARLRRAGATAGIPNLREGVYMWFAGPSFETAAEIKVAKLLGADLVGMSTVPEVIIARKFGLRVAAVSVVTNFATGVSGGNPNHAETKTVAASGSIAIKRLLRAFLRNQDAGATP